MIFKLNINNNNLRDFGTIYPIQNTNNTILFLLYKNIWHIIFNTHLSVKALQNRHFFWKLFFLFINIIFITIKYFLFFYFIGGKFNREIPTQFSIKIYYDYFEYFCICKFKITKYEFKSYSLSMRFWMKNTGNWFVVMKSQRHVV